MKICWSFGEGLALAIDPEQRNVKSIIPVIKILQGLFPDALRLIAHFGYGSTDKRRISTLAKLAQREQIPLLASQYAAVSCT